MEAEFEDHDEDYLMGEEVVNDLWKYVESQNKRGYPSEFHADRENEPFLHATEVDNTCNWAKTLAKQNRHNISISRIVKNSDKFPDCLAEMDGRKQIGVEVTELTTERKQYVKGQKGSWTNVIFGPGQWEQESRQSRLDTPVPNTAVWSLEKFWRKLEERVQRKDEIARKRDEKGELIHLHKLFLLIVTGERMLQASLEHYLKEISIPQPQYFDAVYVMGGYEATAENASIRNPDPSMESHRPADEGYYPVFRVPFNSPDQARHQ